MRTLFTMVRCLGLAAIAVVASVETSSSAYGRPITVGADWFATRDSVPPAFYWGDTLPALSYSGPFTFSTSVDVVLDITDDFGKGDQFRIYDGGVPIGVTSPVPLALSPEVGPKASFNDPTYSSGSFTLGPGDHSIDIETIVGGIYGRGYIRVMPARVAVEVEKSVSVDGGSGYHDADFAPGPSVPIGNDVYFKFVLTNTGNAALTNITLADPAYDLSGCNIPTSLARGRSFQCVIGPFPAMAGDQTNTATATGDHAGQTVSASDTANYFGADPSIDLEKSVSVDGGSMYDDADLPPGPSTTIGNGVYFEFIVTNRSDVTLTNITLTDPDYDLGECDIPTSLEPGGSFQCVIGPFPAVAAQQTNTATVTGDCAGQTVSDRDAASYFGADPSIDLEKSVSVDGGSIYHDADSPPRPFAIVGNDVYFEFIVTNASDVTLTNITLSDPAYDLSGCTIPTSLAPGGSFQCVIGPFPAVAGGQTNTATATGDYAGRTAADSDAAGYVGVDLSIDLEKSVSVDGGAIYHDADSPPGPSATVGNDVYFNFNVTNTGDVTLTNIMLTDPDCDLSGCTMPTSLAPGGSFECVIGPMAAAAGEQTNTATATGDYAGRTVSASDQASYVGDSLSVDVETDIKPTSCPNLLTIKGGGVLPVTSQSSTAYGADASRAVDGNADGNFGNGSVTFTQKEVNPWWQVELGETCKIQGIEIWNRVHSSVEVVNRLSHFYVFVSDRPFGSMGLSEILADPSIWREYVPEAPNPDALISLEQQARYVRIQLVGRNYLSLAEVMVCGELLDVANVAVGQVASQSSTAYGAEASRAVDGNTDGNFGSGSVTFTQKEVNPWWHVDLGETHEIQRIEIWNRVHSSVDVMNRLRHFYVFVSDRPFGPMSLSEILDDQSMWREYVADAPNPDTLISLQQQGRYVRIQLAGRNYLSLAEVKVFGQ